MSRTDKVVKALERQRKKARTPKELADIQTLEDAIFKHDKSRLQNSVALESHLAAAEERRNGYMTDLFAYQMVVDIDYFKKYDDRFGYSKGDELIKKVGEIVEKTILEKLWEYDIRDPLGRKSPVYHPHGEEFFLLLYLPNSEIAYKLAERVRETVHEKCAKDYPEMCKELGSDITVSIGYTMWKDEESYEEAAKRRDRHKDIAKYTGRNRTVGDNHLVDITDEELKRREKEETEKRY